MVLGTENQVAVRHLSHLQTVVIAPYRLHLVVQQSPPCRKACLVLIKIPFTLHPLPQSLAPSSQVHLLADLLDGHDAGAHVYLAAPGLVVLALPERLDRAGVELDM